MELIFRNDDVSMASNVWEMLDMYSIIRKEVPNVTIWSAVTMFSKGKAGPLNPDMLHYKSKDHPLEFFYDVDNAWRYKKLFGDKIVSHGLFHVDHTKLDYTSAEMSILGSCNYLNTDIFVPPYGCSNEIVEKICDKHSIKIERAYPDDGWLSLEFNKFDPKHEKWYFHSWRYTPDSFRRKLELRLW